MWKRITNKLNRRFSSVIAKIFVCILIFWILFQRIEVSEIIETFLKTEIVYIIFAVGINIAGVILGVFRWQVSLAVPKLQVSFFMLLNAVFISRFIGTVMPAFIGGDAIRGYDIFKHIKQGANIFASIFFERICGLISLVAVGSCALFIDIKKAGSLPIITPFIIVYIVLILLIVSCFSKIITKRMLILLELVPRLNWAKDKLKSLSGAIYMYRGYPKVWGSVISLSIIYQFLGILFYYIISVSLSLDIKFITFCTLIPIINLVTITPISPGGLGVKEGMFVVLFNQYGVPPVESLLISLIGTALYMVIILIGSIVYVTRKRVENVPCKNIAIKNSRKYKIIIMEFKE